MIGKMTSRSRNPRQTFANWLVIQLLVSSTALSQETELKFDTPESEAALRRKVMDPGPTFSDYVAKVKATRGQVRDNQPYYETFIACRDYYAKHLPTIFDNPSWPVFIASVADEQHKFQRIKNLVRKPLRNQDPFRSSLQIFSLRHETRDPRSPTHRDFVPSTHSVVPERSNALGNAYRWINGTWVFTGKGYRRVNGKWVRNESRLDVETKRLETNRQGKRGTEK